MASIATDQDASAPSGIPTQAAAPPAGGPDLSSTFPHPPHYYRQYTDENLTLFRNLNTKDIDPASCPTSLYLDPPTPLTGKFEIFGMMHDVSTIICGAALRSLNLMT
jgi:hypothetical protein